MHGMQKLKVHAAPYEKLLQHRTAPRRPGDVDLHRLGAELGMAAHQRLVLAAVLEAAEPIHSLDFQDRAARQVAQIHPAFNFRPNNVVIDTVAPMRMGRKQAGNRDLSVCHLV